MFLSAVWTLILTAPIHWRGSNGEEVIKLNFLKYVPTKKQTHLHIGWHDGTGTSKNVKIMEKVNIFCHSFQKVNPIYYIDSLHRVKYFIK